MESVRIEKSARIVATYENYLNFKKFRLGETGQLG